MKCPNCNDEDCHEFFNEPKEEKETHFTAASIIFICCGVFAFIIALILLLKTNISDERNTKLFGYIMLGSIIIIVISVIFGAHPHYKQIYKVKAVCKKCGYQFMLEQTNIPVIKKVKANNENTPTQEQNKIDNPDQK